MEVDKITLEELVSYDAGSVFARGLTTNDRCGVYLADERYGDSMVWVAKKGHGHHDWTIYAYWVPTTEAYILKHGQKVMSRDNIMKLVPCTDEVFNRYRF